MTSSNGICVDQARRPTVEDRRVNSEQGSALIQISTPTWLDSILSAEHSGWSMSCPRWFALCWHTRSARNPFRTLASFGMSQKNEVQALTFIIRHIPQRCVAGIAFVLAFIETSFNPALYRRKNNSQRDAVCRRQEHNKPIREHGHEASYRSAWTRNGLSM